MNFRRFGRCLLATALAAAFAMPAAADPWRVKNRLFGKVKDGGPEKASDVSGIACAPGAMPRLCLAVDDETQGAQVVILDQDLLIAGDFIPLIDKVYDKRPLELDAEGVAYADGFFYVVGSHGRARHEDDAAKEAKNDAKAAATRQIFRIGLAPGDVDLETGSLTSKPAVTASDALAAVLRTNPELAPYFDLPLQKNGITIEGIAVRGDNFYAAFRGPVLDDGRALIAKVTGLFEGTVGDATVYHLDLGRDTLGRPRGIRDLSVFGDGFLLIAGPEQDPPKKHGVAPGDYAIYAWNEDGAAVKRLDLQPTGDTDNPEALVVLDQDDERANALLLYDGPKEGQPTSVAIPLQ